MFIIILKYIEIYIYIYILLQMRRNCIVFYCIIFETIDSYGGSHTHTYIN